MHERAMTAVGSSAAPPRLGRRVIALFGPHRAALLAIAAMIVGTSVLSVIGALPRWSATVVEHGTHDELLAVGDSTPVSTRSSSAMAD